VAEFQITYWRELPSLVVARDAGGEAKVPMHPRFQEAIDEAAMRLGDVGSDAYLAGWRRGEWIAANGQPPEVAEGVVARLEQEWSPEAVATFLDGLGPAVDEESA
jgi:hypothetical protein